MSGHFPSASFRDAMLERVTFEAIHAPRANFDGARMQQAALMYVEMPAATFRNADMSGASWTSANLRNAALDNAQAAGVLLHAVVLRHARCRGLRFRNEVVDAPDSYRLRGFTSDVLAWPQQRSWLVSHSGETRTLDDAASHWGGRQEMGDPNAPEMSRLLTYLRSHPPRRRPRRRLGRVPSI